MLTLLMYLLHTCIPLLLQKLGVRIYILLSREFEFTDCVIRMLKDIKNITVGHLPFYWIRAAKV